VNLAASISPPGNREKEGAELIVSNEGQGSGEEPENAAAKNPSAYGERDIVKVGDETGEISSGRWPTAIVTNGIS
jgi:hypothetical protein